MAAGSNRKIRVFVFVFVTIVQQVLATEIPLISPSAMSSKLKEYLKANRSKLVSRTTTDLQFSLVSLEYFSKTSLATLEQHGNTKIHSIVVCRTPIREAFEKALNVLSFGKWVTSKGHDRYFHLFMCLILADNTQVCIEKNEIVTITPGCRQNVAEVVNVPCKTKKLTIEDLLVNTMQKIGTNDFFRYNALTCNCQHFVKNILAANDLLTPKLERFVFQSTDSLVAGLPSSFQNLMRRMTTLAAKFHRITGR